MPIDRSGALARRILSDGRTILAVALVVTCGCPGGGGSPTPQALACNGAPSCFLSRGGTNFGGDAAQYLRGVDPVGAKATFQDWKRIAGFDLTRPGGGDARALYFNAGDLNLGRDMNCLRGGPVVACYVTNYGATPGTPGFPGRDSALSDLIETAKGARAGHPFATVAMEFTPNGLPAEVQFYVYNEQGVRQTAAALDTEGPKSVPQMCLTCHGGSYDRATNTVIHARFLPFDLESFQYSADPAYTRAAQEEQFRRLNEIVRYTASVGSSPNATITELIDGWYGNAVATPGRTFDGSFVPQGWNTQRGVYQNFLTPYCRGCHVSNDKPAFTFQKYLDFKSFGDVLRNDVCSSHTMPQAQVPFNKLWASRFAVLVLDDPNVLPLPADTTQLCRNRP